LQAYQTKKIKMEEFPSKIKGRKRRENISNLNMGNPNSPTIKLGKGN